MGTNIIILAAGPENYKKDSGGYPLALLETEDGSLIEQIYSKVAHIKDATISFALKEEEIERFHLDSMVKLICSDARITRITGETNGSGCTALLAACELPEENDLILISANEIIDVNFQEVINSFRNRELAGGAIGFTSIHPQYSFVKLDEKGLVVEASQKNPISKNATTGMFWFSQTKDFVNKMKNVIRKKNLSEDRYYIAPVFNEYVLDNKNIGIYEIDSKNYKPLKTRRHLDQY
ncbi:MAG: hypothetical protein JJ964_00630 [Rhizobiales bacterium]|nr:hypothetical protein [Hyphomicrobiales bacterium]